MNLYLRETNKFADYTLGHSDCSRKEKVLNKVWPTQVTGPDSKDTWPSLPGPTFKCRLELLNKWY